MIKEEMDFECHLIRFRHGVGQQTSGSTPTGGKVKEVGEVRKR